MNTLNLPAGAEGLALLPEIKKGKSICFVCADNQELESLANSIGFFSPDLEILRFPEYDTVPYDRISPSRDILGARIKTLGKLGKAHQYAVFCTVKSFSQRLLDKKFTADLGSTVKPNDSIDFQDLVAQLVSYGYSRMVNAEYLGEFAVRGSVIDIVQDDSGKGLRLDFFGDRLDSIREFDTETQRSSKRCSAAEIIPMTETLIDSDCVDRFLRRYRQKFGVEKNALIEAVKHGNKFNGIENWLPLFYEENNTLCNFLDEKTLVYVPEAIEQDLENFSQFLQERYELRNGKFKEELSFIEPNELYKLDMQEVGTCYSRLNTPRSGFFAVENLSSIAKAKGKYVVDILKQDIASSDKKVVVALSSKGVIERVKRLFEEHELDYKFVNSFADLKAGLSIAKLSLDQGFARNEYIFYSEAELLGRVSEKTAKSRKSKHADPFKDLSSLEIGDLVVHIEHGVGRFIGLKKLSVSGKEHDFVGVEYSGGDLFYLPVENLELLTKYGEGGDGSLDKLGSIGWQKRKAELKKRIKIFSEKLLKIAAERELKTIDKIDFDKAFYQEFEDKFPYTETEDQERCINDVIADFDAGKPMDRLICGDVGFGKTEVALRAACAVVGNKEFKQVAVLVPTTLLARQHYKTFSERFAGTPVRVSQMSKFATRTEINRAKKNLKEGGIDIVIATHSLLAKDVGFKNLGLLIIDEEQHFGVGQKERLKELKQGCHVLTLSATPIPRTLQMSLLGIRDLSVMATPPVNRFPVKTSVISLDILTLREAILREVARDGRAFYVTPRIAYLDGIMDMLKQYVPEVKAVKAHGQMKAAELDKIMNDFYDGKYQVLVSTNIVESGLDVPFANTMIIDHADMYGMSQLYQIRGRVGRSNVQAYAYLTYPQGKKLTGMAEKRLSLLSSLDSLGGGFTLASHDMDLRGYGNLVGDEQSGHIKEVGVELYQQMLKDAIEALKNDKEAMVQDDWSPTINIGLSVQIPASYIPDTALRVHLYRQIASLSDEEKLEGFASDMIDKYGKLPVEVEHLFDIVKLKNLAKSAGVEKLDLGDKALVLCFKAGIEINRDAIVSFLTNNPSKAKLRNDNKLLIFIENSDEKTLLSKIKELLIAISI